MSKPNENYKEEGISDNDRRRRIKAHVDNLETQDLDYCLLLHNISGIGDDKTKRSRLRRYLCTLWTPKANNYWNPAVDNIQLHERSLIHELECSKTDIETTATDMRSNKKKSRKTLPLGAVSQIEDLRSSAQERQQSYDSGLGRESSQQPETGPTDSSQHGDAAESRIITQRRQDAVCYNRAIEDHHLDDNDRPFRTEPPYALSSLAAPFSLQSVQRFPVRGGTSGWRLTMGNCMHQLPLHSLLHQNLMAEVPAFRNQATEQLQLPDIDNLRLTQEESTLPQEPPKTAHQDQGQARESLTRQSDNGGDQIRIPDPHHIDPDEWLEFQQFRQNKSERAQGTLSQRPLTTIQKRLTQMAHNQREHNNESSSSEDHRSQVGDPTRSPVLSGSRQHRDNRRLSFEDSPRQNYPRRYGTTHLGGSSPRQRISRRYDNELFDDDSPRLRNSRRFNDRYEDDSWPRNAYDNRQSRDRRNESQFRDFQAKKDKNAFEAFKRWRLQFSNKNDAAVFLSRLEQCVQNSDLGEREVMNQLPTLFEGDSWYWFNANHFKNLEDFKKAFRKEFLSTNEDDIKDLLTRTQGTDEEASTFLVKFKLLAKDIGLSTKYSEAEMARIACKNLRPEYQAHIRREHIRNFSQLQEECRSITLRNKSIQNLRPPPKPESTSWPHLGYRSNKNPSRKNHVDAIKGLGEDGNEEEEVAALNNHNKTHQTPNSDQSKLARLEAEILKLKQALNKETKPKNEANDKTQQPDITVGNVCFKCKQPGHYANNCSKAGIVCYGCNTPNVTKPKCPKCNPENEPTGS